MCVLLDSFVGVCCCYCWFFFKCGSVFQESLRVISYVDYNNIRVESQGNTAGKQISSQRI